MHPRRIVVLVLLALSVVPGAVSAADVQSITDTSLQWPGREQWVRLLTLQDYNTRVVLMGSLLLGLSAGVIGTFMLLRKRALMGDAISHATLPGIGMAFILMTAAGGTGKNLPGLLLGALVSGVLGMGLVMLIRSQTRLKEDAALGIVLSVFFGLGIAILGVIQKMKLGHAAGLESFIYGKTASMLTADAQVIAVAALSVTILCVAFFKEFSLLCFDQDFAGAQGWPVARLDMLMMGLVVAVTVIGLQAVGLILMIALLVIPPAAARFWTHRMSHMVLLAGLIGGGSCLVGAGLSALLPRMPAGAVIVLAGALVFLLSLLLGKERGVLVRWVEHRRLRDKVAMQHLLRAMFEYMEEQHPHGLDPAAGETPGMPWDDLLRERSWHARALKRVVDRGIRAGWVRHGGPRDLRLTPDGIRNARRVVRNHRLWEMYLISYAAIAPSHVDRDADLVEHVLGPDLVQQLEEVMSRAYPRKALPPSPHVIHTGGA